MWALYQDLCQANHVPSPKCCRSNILHDRHVHRCHPYILHQFAFGRLLGSVSFVRIVCANVSITEFDYFVVNRKEIGTYRRHLSQFSTNIFPCNSARWRLLTPDRICSPSMFWLTMYLIYPESSSAFKAIWHFVGIASPNETFTCGDLPSFSNVHTPFGPLNTKNYYEKLFVLP